MSAKFTRTLAACAAAAALATPVAQASPTREPGSGSAAPPDTTRVEAPPVTMTVDDGFDWGSAAIGAGGAAALFLLSLGGAAHAVRGRAHVHGV